MLSTKIGLVGFTGGDETITNVLKCNKIDAENVGLDLQNDSSTDIVHSSEFSNVVHILAVIPATSCSTERSFTALHRFKTHLHSTMGQQRVSNIALNNIERAYANSVVSNDMDRIIDIFDRRNGRDSYFFQRVL